MDECRYWKCWLKIAAEMLHGKYDIYAIVCHLRNGHCGEHSIIGPLEIGEMKKPADEGLAPAYFLVPKGTVVDNVDDIEGDHDTLWMGDVGREGEIMCGELLEYLLQGDSGAGK